MQVICFFISLIDFVFISYNTVFNLYFHNNVSFVTKERKFFVKLKPMDQ